MSHVRRRPYAYYGMLRRIAPVLGLQSQGMWIVSRCDDVCFVLERPDIFTSSIMQPAGEALLSSDPLAHTAVRGVVNPFFAHRRARALEGQVQAIVDRLLDGLWTRDVFDLMSEYAVPLPIMVIVEMLAIGGSRYREFRRWSEAVVVSATGSEGPEAGPKIAESREEFDLFSQELIEGRSQVPGEDLISRLVTAKEVQDTLSPSQVLSFCKLLLVAGNETATNLIGNAAIALLHRPDQLRRVPTHPDLAPAHVEETLRFDIRVQFLLCRAVRDVDLSGKNIPEGAVVMVVLGSANRDERKFREPDRFDISRDTSGHLAFGHGPHHCLGAFLARMEAKVSLTALLTRFPSLRSVESTDHVELIDSIHLRGVRRLFVTSGARGVKQTHERYFDVRQEERR